VRQKLPIYPKKTGHTSYHYTTSEDYKVGSTAIYFHFSTLSLTFTVVEFLN